MPLRVISGLDAIDNLRSNPVADWPERDPPDTNRIEPLCKPAFSPSFKLVPGEKVFTIGSCFARNIERYLADSGFEVPTASLEWPDKTVDPFGSGVLNNYGVVSIENELRWALDPAWPYDPARHVLQVAPNRYAEPHLAVRPSSLAQIMTYRNAVTAVTKRVAECRVVVMTLGLSEVWFDTETGIYLNRAPFRSLVTRFPARFEMHVLSFDETLASLNNTVALLKKYCRADQRILLTVSPVPLGVTHAGGDVLVANGYSKAVLRAAAEHLAVTHEHVDYFPSYESVTLSERARAWEGDQLHVRVALVRLNVDRMLDAYNPARGSGAALDVKRILRETREEIAAGNPDQALRVLEPLRTATDLGAEHATTYAEACIDLGRADLAREALAQAKGTIQPWRRKLIAARLAVLERDDETGIADLAAFAEKYPGRSIVLRLLVDACCERKLWDEALLYAQRWANATSTKPEAFRRLAAIHTARGDAAGAERTLRHLLTLNLANDADMFAFVEFLMGQKRFDDAARELSHLSPETSYGARRLEHYRAILPTAAE